MQKKDSPSQRYGTVSTKRKKTREHAGGGLDPAVFRETLPPGCSIKNKWTAKSIGALSLESLVEFFIFREESVRSRSAGIALVFKDHYQEEVKIPNLPCCLDITLQDAQRELDTMENNGGLTTSEMVRMTWLKRAIGNPQFVPGPSNRIGLITRIMPLGNKDGRTVSVDYPTAPARGTTDYSWEECRQILSNYTESVVEYTTQSNPKDYDYFSQFVNDVAPCVLDASTGKEATTYDGETPFTSKKVPD